MRAAQDLDVLTDDKLPGDVVTRVRRPLRTALLVAAVVAAIDQATKVLVDRRLDPGPCTPGGDNCIDLFWTLRLHVHYNPGAAFSTGRSFGPLFGVIALVMAAVLLNLARKRTDRLGPVLLGGITGGAIGNLIDRVVRAEEGPLTGTVVDFIDFQWWPIFNVADSAVVVGVIAFVLYSLFEPESEPGTATTADRGPDPPPDVDGPLDDTADGDVPAGDPERPSPGRGA